MTFLLVETKRADEAFEARYTAWQTQCGLKLGSAPREAGSAYDHFPFILYEYFGQVPLQAVQAVALASRATGFQTFLLEKIVRGQLPVEQGQPHIDWLRSFAQERFQRVLDPQASFWPQLATAYEQCREAFENEQALLALPAQPYSTDRLWAIVAGKTALARLTLQALAQVAAERRDLHIPHTLVSALDVQWEGVPDQQGRAERRSPDASDPFCILIEAQHHFYTGLQHYQDVLRWKKDYRSGERSHLLINLFAEMPAFTPAADLAGREAQLQEIGRRVYYTGLAEQTLEKASEHFCRAMAAITELPPTSLGALLANSLEQSEQLRKDILKIRQQQLAKARSIQAASPHAPVSKADSAQMDSALRAAISYLAKEQSPAGAWGDFLLLAEQSTFWVTGYVGWILNQVDPSAANLSAAARWLFTNQYAEGGWGYNSHWPVDADSTANALLFLSGQPEATPEARAPAVKVLLAHQRPDGGFTTIVDAEAWLLRFRADVDNLSGWTASHPCVTAVIALLLATFEQGRYRAQAAQALSYLRSTQHPDGYWNAYWWPGRLYTTCRTVQAMVALNDPVNESALMKAGHWLISSQTADGGWSPSQAEGGQPFHTALAVQALSLLSIEGRSAALERGLQWLLDHQNPDGSWPAVPILRAPSPERLEPWAHSQWRESILGLDVVVPDWRKLFTTATALHALHTAAQI